MWINAAAVRRSSVCVQRKYEFSLRRAETHLSQEQVLRGSVANNCSKTHMLGRLQTPGAKHSCRV